MDASQIFSTLLNVRTKERIEALQFTAKEREALVNKFMDETLTEQESERFDEILLHDLRAAAEENLPVLVAVCSSLHTLVISARISKSWGKRLGQSLAKEASPDGETEHQERARQEYERVFEEEMAKRQPKLATFCYFGELPTGPDATQKSLAFYLTGAPEYEMKMKEMREEAEQAAKARVAQREREK